MSAKINTAKKLFNAISRVIAANIAKCEANEAKAPTKRQWEKLTSERARIRWSESLASALFEKFPTYGDHFRESMASDGFAIYAFQKVIQTARALARGDAGELDQYTRYMLRNMDATTGEFSRDHDHADAMARALVKTATTISTQVSSSAQALLVVGACEVSKNVVKLDIEHPMVVRLCEIVGRDLEATE